jgi:hypothetical protein
MSAPTTSGRAAVAAPVASAATARSQRQLILLAALGVVFAAAVIFVLLPAFSGGSAPGVAAPSPAAASGPATSGRAGARPRGVVDVHLERLTASAAEPVEGGRNPFRMGAAPPPPGAAASAGVARPAGPPVPVAPAAPTGPPPPPPVPPIALKFIGIVTSAGRAGKIAVLTDGRNVMSGKEGATIDGRYRIVRIGEESIQVEHLDGRGRQTIRLSGQ